MKIFGWISYVICFLFIGIVLGIFLTYFETFEIETWEKVVGFALLLPLSYIFLIINVFFHEFGHFVFGKITGYKFVSFRVFSHLIYKDKNGKYKKNKSNSPGIAGQCLMYYDKPYSDKIPFFWYNLGGGIFNLIWFGLSFLVLYFGIENLYVIYFSLISSFIALLLGLSNIFPIMDQNDGANMHNILTNTDCRKALYDQLVTCRAFTLGEDVSKIEILDYEYNSLAPIALGGYDSVYSRYIINNEIEKAGKIIDYFEANFDKLCKAIKTAVAIEINNHNAIYRKKYDNITSTIEVLPKAVRKAIPKMKEVNYLLGYIVYLVYGLHDFSNVDSLIAEEEVLIQNNPFESTKKVFFEQLDVIREDIQRFKGEISTNDEEIS